MWGSMLVIHVTSEASKISALRFNINAEANHFSKVTRLTVSPAKPFVIGTGNSVRRR